MCGGGAFSFEVPPLSAALRINATAVHLYVLQRKEVPGFVLCLFIDNVNKEINYAYETLNVHVCLFVCFFKKLDWKLGKGFSHISLNFKSVTSAFFQT